MASKIVEQVTRHDREIAAIRKVILTGMKMLVKTDRHLDTLTGNVDKLSAEVRELRASQRETDRQLKSLISSLERGSNGHKNQ